MPRRVCLLLSVLFITSLAHAAQIEVPDWLTTTRWGGDFRYRHESIDDEYVDASRHRQRIRLRVWLTTQPGERTTIGFRLATGDGGPRSTNQTLSEGFSLKQFGLDRAWLEFKACESLKLVGGKQANPFATVSQIVWDSDVNPEGISAVKRFEPGGMTLNIITGGYWLQESRTAADQGLLAAQGVLSGTTDDLDWEFAAGYLDYQNVRHMPHIIGPYGNTPQLGQPDGAILPYYAFDYDLLQFLGSAALKIASQTQFALFFEAVENTAISSNRHGVTGGMQLKQKGKLPWSLRYSYREVEADATLASLGDSDFADGRTDTDGHEVSLSITPLKELKLSVTGMQCQVYYPEGERDFTRFMADAAVSF